MHQFSRESTSPSFPSLYSFRPIFLLLQWSKCLLFYSSPSCRIVKKLLLVSRVRNNFLNTFHGPTPKQDPRLFSRSWFTNKFLHALRRVTSVLSKRHDSKFEMIDRSPNRARHGRKCPSAAYEITHDTEPPGRLAPEVSLSRIRGLTCEILAHAPTPSPSRCPLFPFLSFPTISRPFFSPLFRLPLNSLCLPSTTHYLLSPVYRCSFLR